MNCPMLIRLLKPYYYLDLADPAEERVEEEEIQKYSSSFDTTNFSDLR